MNINDGAAATNYGQIVIEFPTKNVDGETIFTDDLDTSYLNGVKYDFCVCTTGCV